MQRLHAENGELRLAAPNHSGGKDDGGASQLAAGGWAICGSQGGHESGANGGLVGHGQSGVVPHLQENQLVMS